MAALTALPNPLRVRYDAERDAGVGAALTREGFIKTGAGAQAPSTTTANGQAEHI